MSCSCLSLFLFLLQLLTQCFKECFSNLIYVRVNVRNVRTNKDVDMDENIALSYIFDVDVVAIMPGIVLQMTDDV